MLSDRSVHLCVSSVYWSCTRHHDWQAAVPWLCAEPLGFAWLNWWLTEGRCALKNKQDRRWHDTHSRLRNAEINPQKYQYTPGSTIATTEIPRIPHLLQEAR